MRQQKTRHAVLKGKLVIIGFGSIAKGALPLILRHLDLDASRITIISRSEDKSGIARKHGVAFVAEPLREGNYKAILDAHLGEGDFLLNLSVEVSSLSLMEYCWRRGVLYLDTCNEPWLGRFEDLSLRPTKRSNYSLREEAMAFRLDKNQGPTAVMTMGANPGLVSILVKQALLNMASDTGQRIDKPGCHEDWAKLARDLGIKAIHIAERDTQVSTRRKARGEFVNTWSVQGFVDEGLQPAELGWGSHERDLPPDGERHGYGCDAAIFLNRPGISTRVRSWTPLEGPYHGFLVTHMESISIADHLTLRDKNGEVCYRPTVHYAYHPCDDAVLSVHEVAGKNWEAQHRRRIMLDEIEEGGMDELGVLVMGHKKGVYWYGSRLTVDEARKLAPYNQATTLQVTAAILAGMVWALRNPRAGIVEPDDLDHEMVMEVAAPYLGSLVGVWGDWTPLKDRRPLFVEEIDPTDPFQFKNVRVN
jgi:homospermidine synthase